MTGFGVVVVVVVFGVVVGFVVGVSDVVELVDGHGVEVDATSGAVGTAVIVTTFAAEVVVVFIGAVVSLSSINVVLWLNGGGVPISGTVMLSSCPGHVVTSGNWVKLVMLVSEVSGVVLSIGNDELRVTPSDGRSVVFCIASVTNGLKVVV